MKDKDFVWDYIPSKCNKHKLDIREVESDITATKTVRNFVCSKGCQYIASKNGDDTIPPYSIYQLWNGE